MGKGIMEGVEVIAGDTCGVTQISFQGLKTFLLKDGTTPITRIELFIDPSQGYTTRFINYKGRCYEATGFSWGYRGEGPHGLVNAIKLCGFVIDPEDIFGWKGKEAVLTREGWLYKIGG